MNLTGVPWRLNRRGAAARIDFPDDEHIVRVWEEDDGTFYVTAFSGGRAEIIHTEAKFSGIAAQALALATIDALVGEFM